MSKWNWIWLPSSIFFFLLNFQAHRSHTNVCSCCCFLLLNVLLLYVPCLIIFCKRFSSATDLNPQTNWLSTSLIRDCLVGVNPLNQSISWIGGSAYIEKVRVEVSVLDLKWKYDMSYSIEEKGEGVGQWCQRIKQRLQLEESLEASVFPVYIV